METNNKLREALAAILGIADHVQMRFEIPKLANQEISELKQIAEAALAEPIKNCEVGTVEEQSDRMRHFCLHDQGGCGACSRRKDMTFRECIMDWGQMPYEEGGSE